ncbi:hypothetical protein EN01_023515 [Vibrio parahaemolyticus]|nr:hypothetical protein EN01_023515 [Vibrio parahaemolyticus]
MMYSFVGVCTNVSTSLWCGQLTNNLRVIRHAWHFYHALILVIKVVVSAAVLRASHLNWALACRRTNDCRLV